MRNLADERLTEAVLVQFENSETPRFREIMQSLVRHLHAFVSEVEPTEEEWFEAVEFLTRTDQISSDDRQKIAEFVRHVPGTAPDGTEMDTPHYTMSYDFCSSPPKTGARAAPDPGSGIRTFSGRAGDRQARPWSPI